MTRVRVLFLLIAAALVASLQAQSYDSIPLAQARDIEWAGTQASGLVLQLGSRVHRFSIDAEGLPRVEKSATLPAGVGLWDFASDKGLFALGPRHLWRLPMTEFGEAAPAEAIADSLGIFRGQPTRGPLRRRIASGDAQSWRLLEPGAEMSRVHRAAGAARDLDLAARSDQELGWGLGYRLLSRLSVPFFAPLPEGGWLARDAERLRYFGAEGDRDWGRAPRVLDSEIIDFEHPVEPLVSDADGDGESDLVIVEPGSGSLLYYRGAGRKIDAEPRDPDQVFRLAGWLLWRWLIDADGDGKDELYLLSIPKLGLLQQLGVIRKGSLPVLLGRHVQDEDGNFGSAPAERLRLDLPVIIAISRTQREFRFRAPVMPLLGDDGLSWLLPGEDGGIGLRASSKTSFGKEIAKLPIELDAGEAFEAPFGRKASDVNGDGAPDPLLLIRNPGGRDRALWMRSR